ncbi:MAG: hypothetical protein JWQ01_3863 [Massilia sp.]|nr:hypothetical protein [Massilia sp.]
MTYDQGREMRGHKTLTERTGVQSRPIRFVNPASHLVLETAAYASGAPRFQPAAGAATSRQSTAPIMAELIAAERQKCEAVVSQDLSKLVVPSLPSYSIGSDDMLSIGVWDHPDLGSTLVTPISGAAGLVTSGAPPSPIRGRP